MLIDYKEDKLKCSGRLGQYLTLYLRIKHEIINKSHKISLRLRIERTKDILNEDINRLIELKENQVTSRIRIADKVLVKKSLPIDFTLDDNINIVLLEYEYEINNEQTLLMNYYGDIIIDNDKSEFLTDATIKSSIILTPINDKKLFIEISKSDLILNQYTIDIKSNIEPDYYQLKINENDWIKIKDISFKLQATNYFRYIQVRGKKDNYYSYSNVIRINPDYI